MVRMSRLGRDQSSGSWTARKAIPAALRSAYSASFGPAWEEKFSRPAAFSVRDARAAHGAWLAEIEGRLLIVTAETTGQGADLSHRQAHALAGRWYRWKTDRHAEDPGPPNKWSDEIARLILNLEELASEAQDPNAQTSDATAPPPPADATLRFIDLLESLGGIKYRVLEKIATAAEARAFLAREAVALSPEGRQRFLGAVLDELIAATALLHRRATGDYAEDTRPARFPEWTPPSQTKAGRARSGSMSSLELYQAWSHANASRTSASTRNRWISVFRDLERFTESGNVLDLSEATALAWRDELRSADRTEKTVNFQYIAAAKAVFGWAARPRTDDGGALIGVNPFANFKLSARKGAKKTLKLRERSLRLDEMSVILPAASAVSLPRGSSGLTKAKRWAAWLLAYTGARPGEICQLRREDFRLVQKRWAVRLTPEAGTIKDREARIVPLHMHLIEDGLLTFIQGVGDGPLFYDPAALRRLGPDDPTNPRRFPHEKVANNLASWVRELGVTDKGIKPNHAWRHTFKTRALVAGIDSVVADYICGHSPKTVGTAYYALEGDAGWPGLVRAIDAFPRYEV